MRRRIHKVTDLRTGHCHADPTRDGAEHMRAFQKLLDLDTFVDMGLAREVGKIERAVAGARSRGPSLGLMLAMTDMYGIHGHA